MFPVTNPSQVQDDGTVQSAIKPPDIPESAVFLGSVAKLREEMAAGKHQGQLFFRLNICATLTFTFCIQSSQTSFKITHSSV